jgi:hypothetical protein|tara:strand:+ start:129 stop:395 length:267 start_codon:yes stop_codon:yes gene_type:complete
MYTVTFRPKYARPIKLTKRVNWSPIIKRSIIGGKLPTAAEFFFEENVKRKIPIMERIIVFLMSYPKFPFPKLQEMLYGTEKQRIPITQ